MTTVTMSLNEAGRMLADLARRVATGEQRIILKVPGQADVALIAANELPLLEEMSEANREIVYRVAWLAKADALRERIAARLGSVSPDSAALLNELREERNYALLGLH